MNTVEKAYPLRKTGWFLLFLLITVALLIGNIWPGSPVEKWNWGLLSIIMVLLALAGFYWQFERSQISSRSIALIATLSAVAAVARVPFAALPGFQPTTFLVIITGFVFGPQTGFMVGSTTALISNFFLGQGPWTPWQMFAWGLAGATAGLLKYIWYGINKTGLVVFCVLWGYLFGWLMNLWFWLSFVYPLTWQTFLATQTASLWMDSLHAIGNMIFYLFFGPAFIKVLKRFHNKLLTYSL